MREEITQIKDPDGNLLFPKTKASAVYTSNNRTLEAIDLNAQENKIERITVNGKEAPIVDKTAELTINVETANSYNEFGDKPSINNVELVGNKTLDDLNIQVKGDYLTNDALLPIKSEIIKTNAEVMTLTNELGTVKEVIATNNDTINDKVDGLASAVISDLDDLHIEKQNVLTAGYGIKIEEDVISVNFDIPEEPSGVKEESIWDEESESFTTESGTENKPIFRTDNLVTNKTITLNDTTFPHVTVNSQDAVLTSNNLGVFLDVDGGRLDIKKNTFSEYHLGSIFDDEDSQLVQPGFTRSQELGFYTIDENTTWTEDGLCFVLPYQYEDGLVDLYNDDNKSRMYCFELLTSYFMETVIGIDGVMMKKAFLEAFNFDELSFVRVMIIDVSYTLGKETAPVVGAFIRNLDGNWQCLFGYHFYSPFVSNYVTSPLNCYTLDLRDDVYDKLHTANLRSGDNERDINWLKSSFNSYSESVRGLSTNYREHNARIGNLESTVNLISDQAMRVSQLENNLGFALNRITQLEITVDNLLNRIAELEQPSVPEEFSGEESGTENTEL